jgi:uncharacterized repeat protein (TIGR03806 family)
MSRNATLTQTAGRNCRRTALALALLGIGWVSAGAQPYGLDSRPPLGPFLNDVMPETAPPVSTNWQVVPAFPNLVFTNMLGVLPVPGTNLLCAWEREGRVWTFVNDSNATTKSLVVDISNQCQGWDDSGLLGLAFHPGYQTNGHMFLCYTWVTPGTVVGSPTTRPSHRVLNKYHDRLSRFTLTNGVTSLATETVFMDLTGHDTWHNGGGIFFHPANGFLYWTDGDDVTATNRQVITNSLFSGVFRIDVDQRGGGISHPPPRQPLNGFTANYYIPNDNPFVGQTGVLEEFFCLGLRSPHRMTIDPPTGRIFIGDVGEGSREEIDIIEPGESGLNFQWNLIEGLNGDLTPPYIGINKRPVLDYPHTEGRAVIGGYVYRGTEFAAELGGRYLFGDNVTRTIWVMNESTTPATKIAIATLPKGDGPNSGSDYTGLSSFGLDHNSELLMCQMSSVGGRIYKLAEAGVPGASRPLPTLLSQTGAFTNLATMEPNPGLLPYTVNSPLWSDGAHKTRWMGIATNTFVTFAPTGNWIFPNGSVFVKHFGLSTNDLNPAEHKRLETRLLVVGTNGLVYGASYKWRADHSDADLVPVLTNEDIVITTATGVRTQTWSYPGRLDCLTCHTIPSGGVLGVNTRQLNGDLLYPSASVTDNQLRALNHVALFSTPLSEPAIPGYAKVVPITDTNATLETRVRSYLDANCAQCHRPGGGVNALFDARFDTPLANQGIVSGTVLNTLGITGAKVVAPTNLAASILYQRDNSLADIKMPPLAKNVIDTNAMPVIAEWINSLPPPLNALPPPWEQTDLGSVGLAGDATYDSGTFTVSGSGNDIWGTADGGHFAYLPITGDAQIVARVVSVQNTDPWAKAGVMFRETLAAGSKHCFMLISSANGAAFQRRITTGGGSDTTGGPAVVAPYWVRLVRTGNVFTGSVSSNGTTWVQVGAVTNAMSSQVNVGLAVSAHDNAALNTSVFGNVTVTPLAVTPPTVALTSPTNGAAFPFGATVPLAATATAANGAVTNVVFLRELTKLGEAGVAPHTLNWNSAPAGNFALRARAVDSFGAAATSAPVNVLIHAPMGWEAFSVKVNFQTNTAPLVPGHLPDYGDVFGNRGNGFSYGWDTNNNANSRYRNSANSLDLRYDTFNHLQKPGGGTTWEIAVPNGLYQVRAVSGDAGATDGNFQLNVEGTLVVSGAPSSAARWVEGIATVTVNDGRLTVGNAPGSVNNKICFIEIASLAPPAAPQLLASEWLTNGWLQSSLQGSAGRSYVIEGSTNLATWLPLLTNSPVSNLLQFVDPSATNFPSRFYRGRER